MADLSRWPATRLTFATSDGSGDRLAGTLNRSGGSNACLVILVHGLTGCEDSAYMLATAAHLLERGHHVLRLNMRGAGPARPLSRQYYHAGRTDDLRDVIAQLPGDLGASPMAIGGFSLGANVMLKYLAEGGTSARPVAAASVSAPIDLSIAAYHFHRPANWPYRRWLLSRMRDEVLRGEGLSPRERAHIETVGSIVAFDEYFTAPRNGFAGAEDYYRQCSAGPHLAGIKVPTLVIHANDDPWIPNALYESVAWETNDCLVPLLTERGGHVGFHGTGSKVPWYASVFADFIEGRAARDSGKCQSMARAASMAK